MYTVAIIIVFWAVSVPPAWITLSKIGTEGVIEKEKEEL